MAKGTQKKKNKKMKTKHELSTKILKHFEANFETLTNKITFFDIKITRQNTFKTSKEKKQEQMQKFGWQDKEPNPKYNSNTSLLFKGYMIKFTNLL